MRVALARRVVGRRLQSKARFMTTMSRDVNTQPASSSDNIMDLITPSSLDGRRSPSQESSRSSFSSSPNSRIPHSNPTMPEQAHLSSPEASGGNDRKGKQRARDDSLDLSAIQNLSIEEQLENAMRSSLVVSAGKEITGTARVTLPRSASSTTSHSVFPALDRKPSGAHITRPISLAHAPKRRRSDRPHPSLERKRSASVTSVREALAGDPLAWLRQSVQEQRAGQMSQYSPSLDEDLPNPEQPSTPTSTSFTFPRQAAHRRTPSSASAKSVTSTTTTSPSPTKKFDYSGAILLSFISGQGPVQKRVQEHARRSSVDAPASPTKSTHPSPLAPQLSSFESTDPSHPAIAALEAAAAGETPSSTASEANQTGLRKFSLPSLSSIQAPSFPKLPNLPDLSRMSAPSLPSMPSMPKFEAPTVSMPRFSTPELPNAREWLPDAWTKGFGMRQGEDPSKKFMDEEDQAEEGEPDWARIKVSRTRHVLGLELSTEFRLPYTIG